LNLNSQQPNTRPTSNNLCTLDIVILLSTWSSHIFTISVLYSTTTHLHEITWKPNRFLCYKYFVTFNVQNNCQLLQFKHCLGISNEVEMEGLEQVFQPLHYMDKVKSLWTTKFFVCAQQWIATKKGNTFSLIYIETLVLQKQNHRLL